MEHFQSNCSWAPQSLMREWGWQKETNGLAYNTDNYLKWFMFLEWSPQPVIKIFKFLARETILPPAMLKPAGCCQLMDFLHCCFPFQKRHAIEEVKINSQAVEMDVEAVSDITYLVANNSLKSSWM